jgi:hypothetical protein
MKIISAGREAPIRPGKIRQFSPDSFFFHRNEMMQPDSNSPAKANVVRTVNRVGDANSPHDGEY